MKTVSVILCDVCCFLELLTTCYKCYDFFVWWFACGAVYFVVCSIIRVLSICVLVCNCLSNACMTVAVILSVAVAAAPFLLLSLFLSLFN